MNYLYAVKFDLSVIDYQYEYQYVCDNPNHNHSFLIITHFLPRHDRTVDPNKHSIFPPYDMRTFDKVEVEYDDWNPPY